MLQHEHIVKFLGHCCHDGKMLLVYEYLKNKILSSYLKGSEDGQKLDWTKWFNIIRGIARGLTYLHTDSGKNIVRRDLKPSNVLLDSNFSAKIADFDLVRGFNRDRTHESTRNIAGTFGYIAPEYQKERKFSTKSDVYSFGVMVLEIIVGQSINRFEDENGTGLLDHARLHVGGISMTDRDHLGIVNDEQMKQATRCVQLALRCVLNDRRDRPDTDDVVQELRIIRPPEARAPGNNGLAPGQSVNDLTISVLEPR